MTDCALPQCPLADPYVCELCGCTAAYHLCRLANGLPHEFHGAAGPVLDALGAERLVARGRNPAVCWLTAAGRKRLERVGRVA